MSEDDLKNLIASNAKAIQALTAGIGELKTSISEIKEEWHKDRRAMYELLSRLARSQSDFYDIQSDFYRRFDQIEKREAKMLEIIDRYLPPDTEN